MPAQEVPHKTIETFARSARNAETMELSLDLYREICGLPQGKGFSSPASFVPIERTATPDEVERFREELEAQPRYVEEIVQAQWTSEFSMPVLHRAVQSIIDIVKGRGAPADYKETTPSPTLSELWQLVHPKYRTPAIQIEDALSRHFEDDSLRGAIGWTLGNTPYLKANMDVSQHAPFRKHTQANRFIYPLECNGSKKINLAFLGDFGTGYSHARYIGRQIAVEEFPYVFSLGDVYYTGTPDQFSKYVEGPLGDALIAQTSRFFLLADNHEKYSGFKGYWSHLDRMKTHHAFAGTHPQDGSYWCVRGSGLQVIGIDTVYKLDPSLFGHEGRYNDPELMQWLEGILSEGKAEQCLNVLCTTTPPYSNQQPEPLPIFGDLYNVLDDIDIWFWGHEHYCALYNRSSNYPFFGSCIGHAGYPFTRNEAPENPPAELLFYESGSRYGIQDFRPNRGLNGFCILKWEPEQRVLDIEYKDWRGYRRHSQKLASQNGRLELV